MFFNEEENEWILFIYMVYTFNTYYENICSKDEDSGFKNLLTDSTMQIWMLSKLTASYVGPAVCYLGLNSFRIP